MLERSDRLIVLFCRAPEAEARAKGLHRAAIDVFAAFLHAWTDRAASAGARVTVVAPPASLPALRRLLPAVALVPQVEGTFGQRLAAALDGVLGDAGPVLVAGGDAAPPSTAAVREAFEHLERPGNGLVLAPADDGGVNAFGVSGPTAGLFDAIDWRTSRVGRQLAEAGLRLGLRVLVTTPGPDLDSAGDARALALATRASADWRLYRWVVQALRRVAVTRLAGTERAPTWFAWSLASSRGPPSRRLL